MLTDHVIENVSQHYYHLFSFQIMMMFIKQNLVNSKVHGECDSIMALKEDKTYYWAFVKICK